MMGFPGCSVVKNLPTNAGDMGSIFGVGRSLGEENENPLLPGKSHGQRTLVGYIPWGCRKVGHNLTKITAHIVQFFKVSTYLLIPSQKELGFQHVNRSGTQAFNS